MNKTGGSIEGYSEDEEVLVYHYGKPGERLKNAPENVKNYYEGKGPQPPNGFFKVLLQTKTNRLIFVFMLVTIAISAVTIFLKKSTESGTVSQLPVHLAAFSFDGDVYASLMVSEKKVPESVLVSVTFNAYDAEKNLLVTENISDFYFGNEVFLRTKFSDYDIIYIEAEVNVADDKVLLRCNVKQT